MAKLMQAKREPFMNQTHTVEVTSTILLDITPKIHMKGDKKQMFYQN